MLSKRLTGLFAVLTSVLLIIGLNLVNIDYAAATGKTGTVTGSNVNIRSGPGTGYPKTGSSNKGAKFDIIEEKNGWYKLKLANGSSGWMMGSYLSISEKTSTPGGTVKPGTPVNSKMTATVNGTNINIRSGPGTGYAKIGKADKGQQFPVIKQSGGWCNIDLSNGKNGWILGSLLTVKTVTGSVGGSGSSGPGAVVTSSTYLIVKGSSVNIRAGAGTGFKVMTTVKAGDKLNVLNKTGDWYQVVLPGKAKGWIAGWLVEVRTVGSSSRGNPDPAVPTTPSPDDEGTTAPDPPPDGPVSDTPPSGDPLKPGDDSSEKPAPVHKLESVKTKTGENGEVLLVIKSSGEIKYVVSRLTGPDRLVLDLENTDLNGLSEPRGRGLVDQVRISQYNNAPMTVRVVLDLEGPVSFKSSLSEDGLELTVVIAEPSIKGKTVVIDAGHGGYDPGAIGVTGLQEKDFNLETALLLGKKLTDMGANVILTREADSFVSLDRRATVANEAYADIFVSIHANSSVNASVNGTCTYYYAPSSDPALSAQYEQRKGLAGAVQAKLGEMLGTRDMGILQANFAVLRQTKMPAILVETAFLSNTEDEALLKDSGFRDKVAQAIAEGVARYFVTSSESRK